MNNNTFSERKQLINKEWTFFPDKFNLYVFQNPEGKGHRVVNLPHDFMIEGDVSPDAASGPAMGFYEGGLGCYTKMLFIPEDYRDELIYLHFDGVMGQVSLRGDVFIMIMEFLVRYLCMTVSTGNFANTRKVDIMLFVRHTIRHLPTF